jgi:DnaJ-class molecular chaperone
MDPESCPRCGGSGYIAQSVDVSGVSEGIAFIRVKCPACQGSGRKDSIPPSTVG